MTQVFFHIVHKFALLSSIAERFYGTAETVAAREFLRINAAVHTQGYVWPGNVLFLPELMTIHPDAEPRVIKLISIINSRAMQNLSIAEREFLAANHTLINNTANNPGLIPEYAGWGTEAAGVLIDDIGVQSRVIGDRLQELESRYLHEYRTKGSLTSGFFADRQVIYDSIDDAMARVASNLTTAVPAESQGATVGRPSSTGQILHWRAAGTEDAFKGFRQHYERMQKVARYIRYGGCLAISIDASLTYDTIVKACQSSEATSAQETSDKGTGLGKKLEGVGGALLGCSVRSLLQASSIGGSQLWCALFGRPSVNSGRAFRKGADFLFESSYAVS